MGRAILGIVAGVVIAMAVVFAAEWVVQLIAPAPAELNMRDPEAVRARVASLPTWTVALVLVGWIVGAGLGSLAAGRIARLRALWPGLVVGAVIFLSTLYNLMTIPHPIWFMAVAVIGIPLASWLGARSAAVRAAPDVAA